MRYLSPQLDTVQNAMPFGVVGTVQGIAGLTIEASDLDYIILRPGWFTRDSEVNYHLTRKGESFQGHDVCLDSLSDLIVKLATTPGLHVRESLGVSNG